MNLEPGIKYQVDQAMGDPNFHEFTIEPGAFGGFDLVACGVYERSSVLAGQYRRTVIHHEFTTPEEAKAYCPTATITEHCTARSTATLPSCPEPWFNPADAGERWEDDY
jgi:hypothetical protein